MCIHLCSEHGVSRSPTVVVAYLMWRECVSLQVAMAAVMSKKSDIRYVCFLNAGRTAKTKRDLYFLQTERWFYGAVEPVGSNELPYQRAVQRL